MPLILLADDVFHPRPSDHATAAADRRTEQVQFLHSSMSKYGMEEEDTCAVAAAGLLLLALLIMALRWQPGRISVSVGRIAFCSFNRLRTSRPAPPSFLRSHRPLFFKGTSGHKRFIRSPVSLSLPCRCHGVSTHAKSRGPSSSTSSALW